MSRHLHPSRQHAARRPSAWLWRCWLFVLALPGACALGLLLLTEPAGRYVLMGALILSALLAIACGAAVTGRLAAACYNLANARAGRSGLEKIMRESHDAERIRSFTPHTPA